MNTRGRKKQPIQSAPEPRRPAGAFRFPPRSRSRQIESNASVVARKALERLRARTPVAAPELPEIQGPAAPAAAVIRHDPEPMAEPAPPPVAEEPPVADELAVAEEPAVADEEPAVTEEPPVGPFSIELDELADQLVDELRRDLGPEPSGGA